MAKMTPETARKIIELRKSQDPLEFYQPTGTQQEFHNSLARRRLICGPNRSGKSCAATAELAMILRNKHPARKPYGQLTIIQFTVSRQQAAQVIGKKLLQQSELKGPCKEKPMIPPWEIAEVGWQKVGMRVPYQITMKNGNKLIFAWSGQDDVWQRIAGMRLDGAFIDEDAGTEELFEELYPRLLDASSDKEAGWGGFIVWAATNTSYSPAFEAFSERAAKGVADHAMFQIQPQENPAVSMEARNELRAVMSDEAARIRLDGSLSAAGTNLIFPQFDHRRHLTADYEPSEQDNLWVGWDPGSKDDYGLMCCAVSQDNPMTVRVIDFFHEKRTTLDHQAQVLADWLEGRTLEGLIVDPSANKTEYSRGKPVIDLFKEILFGQLKVKTERGVLIGRNRLEDTVPLVRRYLDPDPDNRTVRPLLLFNERAKYAADCIAKARLKNGAHKIAFNTIDGKNLESFDLVRYILSRQPHWCHRPPNTRTYQIVKASAIPKAPSPQQDPFAITADMPDDLKLHRMRLRESTRVMESFGATGNGGRSITTRFMDW